MTEKRYFKRMWEDEFYIFDSQTISEKEFDEKVEYEDYQAFADSMEGDKVVDKLNELNEEKEDWKINCLKTVSENSILWNEISILREQGAEPSSAFQQYLDSISTEYDKFWQRKLKKARKDGVI